MASIFRVKVNGVWIDIPVVQGTDGEGVSMRVQSDRYLQIKKYDSGDSPLPSDWTTVFDFQTIATVEGPQGETGPQGVGISSASLSTSGDNYVITFTKTDSNTTAVQFPKPTDGTNGTNGTNGASVTAAAFRHDSTSDKDYIDFTLSTGSTISAEFPMGDLEDYIDGLIEGGEW